MKMILHKIFKYNVNINWCALFYTLIYIMYYIIYNAIIMKSLILCGCGDISAYLENSIYLVYKYKIYFNNFRNFYLHLVYKLVLY